MIITEYTDIQHQTSAAVAVVGLFDGVHLTHMKAMSEAVGMAHAAGAQTIAVVLRAAEQTSESHRCLTTHDEQMQILEQCGADICVLAPTPSADTLPELVESLLKKRLCATDVFLADTDWTDAQQSEVVRQLADSCERENITLHTAVPVCIDGAEVNRHAICEQLTAGDVAGAMRMLGRPYMLSGIVVGGQRKGRELGFPTANMSFSGIQKIIPRRGVYATEASIGTQEHRYAAMTNIGMRPTFDGNSMTVETHLFDFSEEIYGEKLYVSFVSHVRDERRFESVADLVSQLQADEEKIRGKEKSHLLAEFCYNPYNQ